MPGPGICIFSSQVILMRGDAVTQSLVHSQAALGASVLEMQIWGPIPNLIQTLLGRDPAAWLLTAQQMVVLQTEVEKHQWSQRGPQLDVIRCTAAGRWAQRRGKGGVGAAVAPKEAVPETGSSRIPLSKNWSKPERGQLSALCCCVRAPDQS